MFSTEQPALSTLESEQFNQLAAQSLFNATSDAVILINDEQHILCWNAAAAKLYGWSADEALGQRLDLLLFEAEKNNLEALLKQVVETGEWIGEHAQVAANGREITVDAHWTHIQDSDGEDIFLVVNTDITEKKMRALQVYRAQRLESLGGLASGIAHDMSNILGPVLMSIGMLVPYLKGEHGLQLLEFLETSTRRGVALMEQMKSIGDGGEGKKEPMALANLASEIQTLMSSSLPASINLKLTVNNDLWPVIGNATQLFQVVMNLCINAKEAIHKEGEIRVRFKNVELTAPRDTANLHIPAGKYVLINVADNGKGMQGDVLENVLDPFYTTKEGGTGLGLSVAQGIVTSHKGYIDIDSRAGIGTTVKVYLPASTIESQKAISSFLVVDDDRFFRNALGLLVKELGFVAQLASGAEEAKQMINISKPDLVLCDQRLGNSSGHELLRAIREDAETAEILTVLMTANMTEALELDFVPDYYLPKPFGVSEVIEMIDSLERMKSF